MMDTKQQTRDLQALIEQEIRHDPIEVDGVVALKPWDAQRYVRERGYPCSADCRWFEVKDANQPHTTTSVEAGKTRYWARRDAGGLRVGDDEGYALAAPIWGGYALLWVYPVTTLDAAIEQYRNGEFLHA